jgi:hypothetical protein
MDRRSLFPYAMDLFNEAYLNAAEWALLVVVVRSTANNFLLLDIVFHMVIPQTEALTGVGRKEA